MRNEPAGTTKMAIMVAIVAIIVASIALLAVTQMQNNGLGSSATTTEEGIAPPTASSSGTSSTSSTPSRSLSLGYTDALNTFGGYRFQFSNCSGTPGTLALASGVPFLLDNRDAVAHSIKVGSTSYSVGAYGYRIASVTTKGTYNITCDGKGAATLKVE
jgi:hypothetical protein